MYDNVDDDDDDGNIWKSETFWGFNSSNML